MPLNLLLRTIELRRMLPWECRRRNIRAFSISTMGFGGLGVSVLAFGTQIRPKPSDF